MAETFEDETHYAMVMEFMQGGTLFDLLETRQPFPEEFVHRIIAPMFDAVIYCH